MQWMRTTANLVAVAFLSTSLFFFIQDEDEIAVSFLFLTAFSWIVTFYALRALWYDHHDASFNEIFFLFGAHLIPIICIGFTNVISLGDPLFSDAPATVFKHELNLSILSFLALPFLIAATALQFRALTRYSYIRYGSQSTSGLPAEGTALFLFLVSGYTMVSIGFAVGDAISVLWGLFFLLAGFSWLLTK
ncbi:MAG: hypothetical protein ACE5OZ_07650 [Candidatus Heimdallarchaeota archaeon]